MPSFPTNKPTVDRLRRQLKLAGTDNGGSLPLDDPDFLELMDEILAASIADVEIRVGTAFDAVLLDNDKYDGTGGTTLFLRRHPILAVQLVKVELPVLALTRTYTTDEIKIYAWQGMIQLFTYKLAAENASLHLDAQIYGNLIPKGLPQVAHVTWNYGFAQYDEDNDVTTFDGGATVLDGDQRPTDPMFANRLKQLQQAAVCDAAASVLAQVGALGIGVIQSVSFDGLSESNNPQAYGPQVEALVKRRDELLTQRKRLFIGLVS